MPTNLRQRSLAALTGGVLMGTLIMVPMLDRFVPQVGVALETEHAEGVCVADHDHAVCVQVAKNLGTDTDPAVRDVTTGVIRALVGPRHPSELHSDSPRRFYRTRAPPRA